jgi:hypothetical protein
MKKIALISFICLFFNFSCEKKTSITQVESTEPKNDITTDVVFTEIDFYGEWYCETPAQKIAEKFETAGSKNTYIFFDNNTYESNFIVVGEEDEPLKYRGRFSILNSNIIIFPEDVGTIDGKWIETKGLARGPFTYPYQFYNDGRLQINDDIYWNKRIPVYPQNIQGQGRP